jgi:DNA-binding CsgD family transcriptional regulator
MPDSFQFADQPVILVDGECRIHGLTPAATKALDTKRGLFSAKDRRLCFVRNEDADRFLELLASAHESGARRVMRFAVPGEPDPNTIVCSLSSGSSAAGRYVTAVVHYRNDIPKVAPTDLINVFDLTPAEQLVASAIVDGKRLSDHARSQGISHETARWHAKNVLSKAGCSSQIEFVRLALNMVSDLR